MKQLLSLALALATLTMWAGLATAQTTDRSTTSGTSSRGKPTKEQMTGKVTEVNSRAKTFTVTAKGNTVVFSGANLSTLPKVGQVVDITYTQAPGGGPLTSITFNESRSNVY
jgi:hypothetical protein